MFPIKDDNPTTAKPVMTVTLIAINTIIFLYQVSLGPREAQLLIYQYGAIPAVVFGSRHLPANIAVIPSTISLFTSMFLHGGWMHLIGNMWYLWIFGDNVEAAMGRFRFLVFYLVSGLAASLCHAFSNLGSTMPTIGASGAISGVLGAYFLLYPRAQVLVLIPIFFFIRLMYVPAMLVLGFWFLLQLLSGTLSTGQGGGVAWWAHIGGFVAGMLLVGLFKRRDVRFFNPPHPHYSSMIEW